MSEINNLEEKIENVDDFNDQTLSEREIEERILKRIESHPKTHDGIVSGIPTDNLPKVDEVLKKLKSDDVIKIKNGKYTFSNENIRKYLEIARKSSVRNSNSLKLEYYNKTVPIFEGIFLNEDRLLLNCIRSPILDHVVPQMTFTNILSQGGEEVIYKNKLRRYELCLLPIVTLGQNLVKSKSLLKRISLELLTKFDELSIHDGYLKVSKKEIDSDHIKQKVGLRNIEKNLSVSISLENLKNSFFDFLYIASSPIITPSVDTFQELEKTLVERISIAKDVAEDNGVLFSTIPLITKNKIYSPNYGLVHRFFSKKERHDYIGIGEEITFAKHCIWNVNQAARNSINPEFPFMCNDYSRYCGFFKPEQAKDGIGSYDLFLWLSYYISNESQKYHLLIDDHRNEPSIQRISFPNSIDEILAYTALELSLNHLAHDIIKRGTKEKTKSGLKIISHEHDFNGLESLSLRATRYSFTMDDDPIVIIPNVSELKKFSLGTLLHLSEKSRKKGYLEVIERMRKNGLLEIYRVSQYWPVLMKNIDDYLTQMKIPAKYVSIIRDDFPTKNGTNKLRQMISSMNYQEMIQSSWENLYSGRRWII